MNETMFVRMKRLLLLLMLLMSVSVSLFSHSVTRVGDYYKIQHTWKYENEQWSCSLNIPVALYELYRQRTHYGDGCVHYALSDFDRDYIRNLVQSFREGGRRNGFSDYQNVLNVIAFVQSLRYVTDIVSKYEENYVRYPIETLVDGVGDCEDMAILAASIMHEMGYDVLFVQMPNHLALAIKSSENLYGSYYEYNGSKYYYLETTDTGWAIGQIPDEFRSNRVQLIPLVYKPKIIVSEYGYNSTSYYATDETVNVYMKCIVENLGPGQTRGLSMRVTLEPFSDSETQYYQRVFKLDELPESTTKTFEVPCQLPRPLHGNVKVSFEGSNFEPQVITLKNLRLN